MAVEASLGRVDAIEDVYNRRYAGFHRGVAALVGGELAHDAVQEGFARALRKRGQFSGAGPLDGWIWRIVVRTALDMRRDASGLGDTAEANLGPAAAERDPRLAEALRALPPRRRLVVFLRYFADLSYAEIADACGVTDGTVAATLAQAHAELRRSLATSAVEE